jgi:flagellar basal-body rod protein FlgB
MHSGSTGSMNLELDAHDQPSSTEPSMKHLFSQPMELTARVMDLRLERQNVVMANLANLHTPGYRARRLEFEQELQAALKQGAGRLTRTSDKHMPVAFDPDSFDPRLLREFRPSVVQGQDSVDLDREMALLAKNTLLYNALATVIHKGFDGMSKVIAEGGR